MVAAACGSSRRPDDSVDAVDSAQREAASAFGDGTVFLERFVERPRHVEVQVFGDQTDLSSTSSSASVRSSGVIRK